ncbi:MAG: class I SAM-dependent methyltransferase [Xanthomonadales bacterium]|nr:class I SAM-dependent methyltransferase [Xanthomonadales bacterium]
MMKKLYVSSMHGLRRALAPTGLLAAMASSNSKTARWMRSLFSIYDSNDMVSLDVAWWTYSAIERVEALLDARKGAARVFEYGAGASTIWLAKRAAKVNSVEHDVGFLSSMQEAFAAHVNVEVMLVEPQPATGGIGEARSQRKGYENANFDDYVSAIRRVSGDFDVIIIDGRARSACLAEAVPRLAQNGIIVFDNSNRRAYRQAIAASGLDTTVYSGLAPALPYRSETTILQRVSP